MKRNNPELPHYGLYGMNNATGLKGFWDFLRSPEQIEAAKIRQENRLATREAAAIDRQETRLEVGEIRRDRQVLKQEIRTENLSNNAGTVVGNLIRSIFTPKQTTVVSSIPTTSANPNYQSIDDGSSNKPNQAGGWVLGIAAAGVLLGTMLLVPKKNSDEKPIENEKK
ncbi:hypothetical protein [Pseudotamlana carrageenivorans]|uniref:Uncharacterized protein n=1 Tax=Pseudotamlana carrageenivorans TaxID=2069432 RepID=A0A2I7SER2_9FLAO|nr:hypothetical protein [Tamlana carrageenivorans]AUS04378.1 hypothetical protein C1A40_02325 [Tamlana carrageenivorans]